MKGVRQDQGSMRKTPCSCGKVIATTVPNALLGGIINLSQFYLDGSKVEREGVFIIDVDPSYLASPTGKRFTAIE
jgi:hypothetical protein